MKNKILILIIFLSFYCVKSSAQTAMGEWRTHFAYNSVTLIEQTPNKVYAVSDGALFSIDKLDGNMEIYSKLTGLNDAVVSALKYDMVNKQLIIGYNNGNIDLITTSGIINIPDFYNKVMTVNKNINHITIHDNKAYLSCNFGIIVLNLKRREIAETYYIGTNASEVNVINTTIHENEIYALSYTSVMVTKVIDGISQTVEERTYYLYKADLNNSNLVNYENWIEIQNLPANTVQAIASFGGKLFIQSDWRLFIYNNANWNAFTLPNNDAVSHGISISQGKMIVANERNNIYIIDEKLNAVHLYGVVQYASSGVYDTDNDTYWFAGSTEGVVSYSTTTTHKEVFKPNGPAVNTPWDMVFAGEKLFVVPGGRWGDRYARWGHIMIYENGEWTNINGTDIKAQAGMTTEIFDFVNVAVDPNDNSHFFVTSYGTGLYEFRNNQFYKRYLTELEPAAPSNPQYYTRVDGAVFDSNNNLFVANSEVSAGIKVLSANGEWRSLSYPDINGNATLGKILINSLNPNHKWVLGVRSGAVGVFDDNGTIEEQSDDRTKFMRTFADSDNEGEEINPASIYCIAQDMGGVIWVGSNIGPLLFYNSNKVFESGYTCSRVKISRNDGSTQADYLLVEETIKAIAIDGANRKWLGTANSGVYLMSENGQETIQHFTTDNSPLLSNEIFSIAINPVSGEVFFATGAGIISYQSDAATAKNSLSNVYAYPNPVRENFTGVITITGLVKNTQVKITDLNGNLICETVSNGSIATWDGKDVHGRKVNTGIYLALCVTEDGTDSAIAKIMVVN